MAAEMAMKSQRLSGAKEKKWDAMTHVPVAAVRNIRNVAEGNDLFGPWI